MKTLQELLDSVAADLNPAIDYTARLCSGGYRTPYSVRQADNAQDFQQDCGLLPGDAKIIWNAAARFAGVNVAADSAIVHAGAYDEARSRSKIHSSLWLWQKGKQRAASFGKLFREYLKGTLSSRVRLRHQTSGKSIVDIRLQAYVVGPSVRVFGMCLYANSVGICEPLSPALEMLLIPHMPDSFASLVALFSSMPKLVQDLWDHYEQAATDTRKLRFLGRRQEQLPFTFWDPEAWTDAYQLGPTSTHKLVYLATNQHEQQCVVKFTQRYGVEAHKAWAAADLAPQLLEHQQLAGMWQQIVMEYLPPELPDASGWVTMRYLMQLREEQLKAAPQQLVLAPEMVPQLVQQAEQLLRDAHATTVSGLPAAHGDARPDNIMICVKDGKVLKLKLVDVDWGFAAGRVVYPALLNTKYIVWPEGVAPGKVLEQKHDTDLLHLQSNRATQSVVCDWRSMFSSSVEVSDMDMD